jgi:hypothetical protein
MFCFAKHKSRKYKLLFPGGQAGFAKQNSHAGNTGRFLPGKGRRVCAANSFVGNPDHLFQVG